MAIYHFSAKIISRKTGRSATAAAAYRAGVEITDKRTGELHDYTRKAGVASADIIMPSDSTWSPERSELWNAVEAKNKRGDAQVAREFLVALPDELSPDERRRLAVDFAQEIADRYGIAADVAIHAPDQKGDSRNHHAHILTTTNRVQDQGFGNKARELDLVAHNKDKGTFGHANEIERLRARWSDLANDRLREAGVEARIDHRTLEAQGIEREPTKHLGPTATAIERRTGESSRRRQDFDQAVTERLTRAKELGQLERERDTLQSSILDLSGDLAAAKTERDRMASEASKRAVEASASVAVSRYAQALENVTWETLATVPGLLPAPAIRQAIQQVSQEVQAESQVQEVDVEAVRRQVQAQPALQQRLQEATQKDRTAKATLDDIAGMGFIKRQLNDTKWMTEQAHKLQEEAKHDRAQVAAAVEHSPQVQAALKANDQTKQTRQRTAVDAQELAKIAAREPGQAPYELRKHSYTVPKAVERVMNKARAIAPNSLQGMQLAEVERMTARAADVAHKEQDNQNDFQKRVSRFVVPAEQRRQQLQREQSQARDNSPGLG